jgi:dolichol-phosphate mannosyltransferase
MSGDVIREALIRVTKWGLRRRGTQLKSLFRR